MWPHNLQKLGRSIRDFIQLVFFFLGEASVRELTQCPDYFSEYSKWSKIGRNAVFNALKSLCKCFFQGHIEYKFSLRPNLTFTWLLMASNTLFMLRCLQHLRIIFQNISGTSHACKANPNHVSWSYHWRKSKINSFLLTLRKTLRQNIMMASACTPVIENATLSPPILLITTQKRMLCHFHHGSDQFINSII